MQLIMLNADILPSKLINTNFYVTFKKNLNHMSRPCNEWRGELKKN